MEKSLEKDEPCLTNMMISGERMPNREWVRPDRRKSGKRR